MNKLEIFIKDTFSLSSHASAGVTYAVICSVTLIVLAAIFVAAYVYLRR
jgi:hypothetical protein